jgi:hypothetical protein
LRQVDLDNVEKKETPVDELVVIKKPKKKDALLNLIKETNCQKS